MKKAHIISHSHWDREWYLPYEKHHMLFIELMDTLLDTLEKDPEYRSFHLDGQTILLEDYLQVRPEKKEKLKKAIEQGKIIIGPWYVLQDEFLTSSEANVRNLLIGHREAQKYGPVCKVGPSDLAIIKGELRSQKTDGWYTLVNTASSRIYLKQMNQRCQTLFEKVAEPLATIAYCHGKEYPHSIFVYGWKTLMQNHPHDSICGCSVDEVHREMVTRFEKAEQIGQYLIEESMNYLGSKMDTTSFPCNGEGIYPFMVLNSTGWERSGVVTVELEVAKKYFKEGPIGQSVQQLKNRKLPMFKVIDTKGNKIPATITEGEVAFGYELPKDQFRQPYFYKKVYVTLEVEAVPSFGWKTYALVEEQGSPEREQEKESLFIKPNKIENKYFIMEVKEDGSLTITHKESQAIFTDLCVYEDTGDIGNEYVYKQPIGDIPITTKNIKAKIEVKEDTPYRAVLEIKHTLFIPEEADQRLEEEIQTLIEFRHRKAQRSAKQIPLEITTLLTIERESKGIKVQTIFENKAKDHRLRVLFPTGINTSHHYADSIFEVVKRENIPSTAWENPSNAQHQQAFVNVHDENQGLTIANKGLYEYEILRDSRNTIALTLLRGVRELGDWGVFLTPEAQCLGVHTVAFEIIPHGRESSMHDSYREAYQFQVSWSIKQIKVQSGDLDPDYGLFSFSGEGVIHSSLKVSEETQDIIVRWYNICLEEKKLWMDVPFSMYQSNILEEKMEDILDKEILLGPAEIRTIGFKKEK